jgi:hypothetical protein
MAGVETRSFDEPDETLPADKAGAARVRIGGLNAWGSPSSRAGASPSHFDANGCPAPHAGYIASGRLHVRMDDGSEAEAGPGEVITIAPVDFGENVTLT